MKIKLLACLVGAFIVTAAPVSEAQVAVSVGFNTCNDGYYQSCPVYAPPIGVYFGGGSWGGDRHGHNRGDRRGYRHR
jgi:hypothetical protein